MPSAFRPAQEDMRSAVMLILTKDDEGLPGQRIRISTVSSATGTGAL